VPQALRPLWRSKVILGDGRWSPSSAALYFAGRRRSGHHGPHRCPATEVPLGGDISSCADLIARRADLIFVERRYRRRSVFFSPPHPADLSESRRLHGQQWRGGKTPLFPPRRCRDRYCRRRLPGRRPYSSPTRLQRFYGLAESRPANHREAGRDGDPSQLPRLVAAPAPRVRARRRCFSPAT